MANRVLSIEVGQSLTRVIEIDYKSSKPKIYKYFSFPTPEGTVEDGVIGEKKADFCRLLKSSLRENGITTVKTVFTVNSGSIANREVTIPIVKTNRIQQLLLANSSEYFPVDLSQYQLAYRTLERDEERKQLKLQVYAIPRKLLESYEEIAKVCNLTIQAIDYVGNSIYQAMMNLAPEGFAVSLKVDEALSVVTITKDGNVVLQRSVAYGLDGVIDSISDSMVLGYKPGFEAVYEYMRRNKCVRQHILEEGMEAAEEGNEKNRELLDNATESVRYLVGNVSRVLDYYISRNENVTINKITLLGLGSECAGLSELLTNELTIPVTSETSFDSGIQGEHAANYMACIGAAFSPLDIAKETNAKKTRAAGGSSEDSMLVPALVCGASLLVALILVGIPLVQNMGLKNQKENLENRIVELQPAKEVYETYTQMSMNYQDVLTMEAYTVTPNSALLDFLSEFEANAPSNVSLDNLSAGTEGVSMTLKANSKEEIGKLLTALRGFESVGEVETGGFQEEQDDAGTVKVSCSITCTYAISLEDMLEEYAGNLSDISKGYLDSVTGNGSDGTTDGTGAANDANTTDNTNAVE